MQGPTSQSDTPAHPGAWWLHPFLVAAFPVVFLFAENIQEQLSVQPLGTPLGIVLGGAVVVLGAWLLAGRTLGFSAGRAALAASLAIGLVLTYGHAWNLAGEVVGLHWYLLFGWVALGLVGVVVILRAAATSVRRMTGALNAVVGLLIAINLVPIGSLALRSVDAPAATASGDGGTALPGATRDVWYIVVDRYAGSTTLQDTYGFDNGPFLEALRERGFAVAEKATANYLKTPFSIASSLNMEELDFDMLESEAAAADDWGPVYRRLQASHAVERFLHERGYRYLHVGSRRGPTAENAAADMTYLLGATTEFTAVFADTTILAALNRVIPSTTPRGIEEIMPAQTEFQLRLFDRLADAPGRKFVFAHMLVPHPPYAFNEDGSRVTDAQRASRSVDEQYIEQVKFTNASMLRLIDRLHAGARDTWPIIVLASDEGPFPSRYAADEEAFKWLEATPQELKQKFSILTAISVPGVDEAGLQAAGFTDDLMPVNLFRVVFNAAFEADLPLQPQRSWVFVDQRHLYDAVDITDRIPR